MQQDLGVSFYALIELLVRHRSILETEFVGHYKAGLRTSADDQISQVSVVRLDIALSGTCEWSDMELKGSRAHNSPRERPFSKSLPNEMRIWPLPDCSSGAPGSEGT